jgi:hypothetical protein
MLQTMTPLRLAQRMSRLGTETAFEVLVRARALEAKGKDIVHLEIGEPDFDTPSNVIEAGVKALKGGYTLRVCRSFGRPSPITSRKRGTFRSLRTRWSSFLAASRSCSS